MKKLHYFIVLLFIANISFAQETEKLPEFPWAEIVEMNSDQFTPIRKWVTDINIGVKGLYTDADILVIKKTVKKLDSLTETISIKFTNKELPNLIIHFSDTPIHSEDNFNSTIHARLDTQYDGYVKGKIYVYKIDKTEIEIQKTLEARIAKTIVNASFTHPLKKERRHSIFNPMGEYSNGDIPLNEKDMTIIKTVYAKNFDEKSIIAEKQFDVVLKNLRNDKISDRDRTIWWVKNPISVIILPAIILLLVFIFLVNKINQALVLKIRKDWLRFGVLAFISLIFVSILIILCSSTYDFLTLPQKYYSKFIRKDTIISTIIFSTALFPFLFLFRFIEIKIQKTTISIFTKTMLIFLSTGFLPFVSFMLLMYFTVETLNNRNYEFAATVFVYMMVFASVRALISYFIFKEKN
ncbi:hypothetical protein [Polaribacter ponticola]|uniref:Uncharacterized protein n=1 Tax=Polaribacter ponticola TaxID=2978475 RepID=A0ABT5SAZ6_9FLAO|nr:hypothetical protein [Polaribacter sp. MSW5]MDD7915296.1 hypothetical protein [Polaribacter sp. MSW5]